MIRKHGARSLRLAVVFAMLLSMFVAGTQSVAAVSPNVVISQVYGGGGNSGATYKNDFIELFNRGTSPVNISAWSLQYASNTGNTWSKTNLAGTIQPGRYYLVQQAAGTGGTTNLPTPDATGTMALSASNGKVALVTNQTLLTCGASLNNCFPSFDIHDFVGFGSANNYEGAAPTAALTNTTAALRNSSGCTDTDNNSADFATGTPTPRNTASPLNLCQSEEPPPPIGCGTEDRLIGAVQGTNDTAALNGQTVTVQGVVVGDYEGASPALRGFYVQDTGDDDAATSDGIFVFTSGANNVSLGQVVQVTGTAAEFQGQTQISGTVTIEDCEATATIVPTDVTLPFASATDAERYEGMLVRFPQTLYVTEHFQLGRFGQVVVSSGGRLRQPTNVTTPGAAANALQAQNNLNRIIVDDDTQAQNPDPIKFGRGGQPLSASNTLRGGDTATGMVGVMTYTWAGHRASGNAYRLRPLGSLGGVTPDFQPANHRPATPTAVGGRITVSAANVLNYFNTFAACTGGVGGATMDCRGADNVTEFDRQAAKIVAGLVGGGADVIGLMEIENDGYGSSSALQDLVNRLNSATALGTYAFIDADAGTGQTNALGDDAIKVAIIYKPGKVTPVGTTAVLNTTAFVTGGDSGPRNRPSLAQAFEENATGARFVLDVNHLKSKGSACDAPDAGDGQGNCNAVRVNAANLLTAWLAGDPTGINDPDMIIVGDLNAYAKEDPITTIKNVGYTNLIEGFGGQDAYSYAFNGQWGYLDHALATSSLASQVTGAAEWHINADEPTVLDYNTEFKSAGQVSSLYAADQYRASDHDSVLVGLNLINALPVAVADATSVAKNSSVAIFALDNDYDPEANPLSVVRFTQGKHGSVKYSTKNNNFRYTPNKGFSGTDSFTYTISDGYGGEATATVTVTVK